MISDEIHAQVVVPDPATVRNDSWASVSSATCSSSCWPSISLGHAHLNFATSPGRLTEIVRRVAGALT